MKAFKAKVKELAREVWEFLEWHSPLILIIMSFGIAVLRFDGLHGQTFQFCAHSLTATLFTLAVCRTWRDTGSMYFALGVALSAVEVIAFLGGFGKS